MSYNLVPVQNEYVFIEVVTPISALQSGYTALVGKLIGIIGFMGLIVLVIAVISSFLNK